MMTSLPTSEANGCGSKRFGVEAINGEAGIECPSSPESWITLVLDPIVPEFNPLLPLGAAEAGSFSP